MSSARAADLKSDEISPLADPSSRLAAVVLDAALPASPHLVLMPLGAILRSASLIHTAMWLGWVAFAVFFVVDLVLLARFGQTVGKRLVGLRIVRADGSRASLGRLFWLRTALPGALGFVPFVGWLFGAVDVLMIFTGDRRTIHDRLADTIVVDLRAPTKTESLATVFE